MFLKMYRGFLHNLISIIIILLASLNLIGQTKMTRSQYIDSYAELAMKEMIRTGIPASITLAQACLESDNGNSTLAKNARNHFGIKCHEWKGRKFYHDDDEIDECFRKYQSVDESFEDHSEFLTLGSRYKDLFELNSDDYKSWAIGLKKAGYATSNKYADLLIGIIEENELYKYDQEVIKGKFIELESESKEIKISDRSILINNRIEFIQALPGDNPKLLREEFDLYPREIYRYNDIDKNYPLEPGMIIYLQPKRFRAEKGNEFHELQKDESMWDISQIYGVRLKRLYKLNNMKEGENPEPGTRIWLRKRKPANEIPAKLKLKTAEEEPQIKLEFEEF